MKMFGVLIASVGLIAGGLCDDRLIPFDGFFVSVETNDWMNRPKDRQGLNVNFSLARYEDDPGANVSTSVNCFEFPAGQRMFHQDEIQAFSEAAKAGKLGKEFFKETQTQTIGGMAKTTFTTVKEQGEWVIRVNRAGKLALFEVEEGARLRKALDEAKAGEKWFQQLLVARKLPDMKPQMRPPLSNGYHVSSTLGKIQGRGIVYEVSVTARSFREAPRYSINHGIEFRTTGGGFGSSGGLWVKDLLGKVSEALENIEKGEAYSFKSDHTTRQKLSFLNK